MPLKLTPDQQASLDEVRSKPKEQAIYLNPAQRKKLLEGMKADPENVLASADYHIALVRESIAMQLNKGLKDEGGLGIKEEEKMITELEPQSRLYEAQRKIQAAITNTEYSPRNLKLVQAEAALYEAQIANPKSEEVTALEARLSEAKPRICLNNIEAGVALLRSGNYFVEGVKAIPKEDQELEINQFLNPSYKDPVFTALEELISEARVFQADEQKLQAYEAELSLHKPFYRLALVERWFTHGKALVDNVNKASTASELIKKSPQMVIDQLRRAVTLVTADPSMEKVKPQLDQDFNILRSLLALAQAKSTLLKFIAKDVFADPEVAFNSALQQGADLQEIEKLRKIYNTIKQDRIRKEVVELMYQIQEDIEQGITDVDGGIKNLYLRLSRPIQDCEHLGMHPVRVAELRQILKETLEPVCLPEAQKLFDLLQGPTSLDKTKSLAITESAARMDIAEKIGVDAEDIERVDEEFHNIPPQDFIDYLGDIIDFIAEQKEQDRQRKIPKSMEIYLEEAVATIDCLENLELEEDQAELLSDLRKQYEDLL